MTESHNSMKTGIPNRQKTAPKPAASCRIDYFARVARPPCSTAWRFFTGDDIAHSVCGRRPAEVFSRRVPPVAVRPGEGPFSIAASVKLRPDDFMLHPFALRLMRPHEALASL